MTLEDEKRENGRCCGGRNGANGGEHTCGCGGHNGANGGEHTCGCGGHDGANGGEHTCGCGGHSGANGGEHTCGCGGHSGANGGEDGGAKDDPFVGADFPLPKPTLITLATTLAQQAMVSMGILPHPATGKSVFLFNQATHLIDAVELLFEKTAGNRTDEETRALENIEHELRMLYVAAVEEKKRRDSAKK